MSYAICLRECYEMSGTYLLYQIRRLVLTKRQRFMGYAASLRARYEVPGTEVAYGATSWYRSSRTRRGKCAMT